MRDRAGGDGRSYAAVVAAAVVAAIAVLILLRLTWLETRHAGVVTVVPVTGAHAEIGASVDRTRLAADALTQAGAWFALVLPVAGTLARPRARRVAMALTAVAFLIVVAGVIRAVVAADIGVASHPRWLVPAFVALAAAVGAGASVAGIRPAGASAGARLPEQPPSDEGAWE